MYCQYVEGAHILTFNSSPLLLVESTCLSNAVIDATDGFAEMTVFRTFKDEASDGSSVAVVSDSISTISESTGVANIVDVVIELSTSLDGNWSLKFGLSGD